MKELFEVNDLENSLGRKNQLKKDESYYCILNSLTDA
jgi:hypothetical protein